MMLYKLANIIYLAFKDLFRHNWRNTIIVVTTFLGASSFALSLTLSQSAEQTLRRQSESLSPLNSIDILLLPLNYSGSAFTRSVTAFEYKQGVDNGIPRSLTNKDISKIKTIDGVQNVTPIHAVNPEYLTYDGKKKLVVSLIPFIPSSKGNLIAGQLPESLSDTTIILGEKYVESLGFTHLEDVIGKSINIGLRKNQESTVVDESLTVVGVAPSSLIDEGACYVAPSTLDTFFSIQSDTGPDTDGTYSHAIATIDSAKNIQTSKDLLQKAGYGSFSMQDKEKGFADAFTVVTNSLYALAIIIILLSSVAVSSIYYLSVQEKTPEIGLMKALGASKGLLFFFFCFESVVLSLFASLIGLLTVFFLLYFIRVNNLTAYGINLSTYTINALSLHSVYLITGLISLVSLLSVSGAAFRASRINAIKALST